MELSKTYNPKEHESPLYAMWERGGYFKPSKGRGKPFVIILPPPNANDPLHIGHAMYTVEDIMIRYHRMRGEKTVWVPGYDHAGIETQVVFERKLNKEGKSRFDFSREEFYRMVWEYCANNWKTMKKQLEAMGFSCDWTRTKFTLDPDIVRQVNLTFKKLYDEGLVYKGTKLVNWDPKQQTVLSDLEVEHEERDDTLYFIDYGAVTIATVRPETIFADVAVAVNPRDKRYKGVRSKVATIPLVNRAVPIIVDPLVEPDFGTGALKITPGHDFTDAEIGERHKLPAKSIIGFDGRMLKGPDVPEKYWGMKVTEARAAVVEDLKKFGKLKKSVSYRHTIAVAERSKAVIEPLLSEQWFIKIKPLADPAIAAVKSGKIKIVPKYFEKVFFHWMKNIKDWPISRQIVWGIRFPVYTNKKTDKVEVFVDTPKDLKNWEQDPNTFDTWFSSGQWPYLSLGYPDSPDYKLFYPTSVMETGYDILFFWVARMIMLGLYRTGKIPFKTVYLHGLIRDERGLKMSKSLNNVINPLEVAEKFGADSVRWALIASTTPGKDANVGLTKITGARNFTNKIWNASRFVLMNLEGYKSSSKVELSAKDKKWLKELSDLVKKTTSHFDSFRFGLAADGLFNFFWHRFADHCLEEQKPRLYNAKSPEDKRAAQHILATMLTTQLQLLHPFMPFVTEAIWQKLPGVEKPLISSRWPK
jgi:valyl-tRNA synthetase